MVQPRQAPMPQAIFFSRLTRQGVPFSAHSRAALRIMGVGPQIRTTSYAAGSYSWVTKPWNPTRPLSVDTLTSPASPRYCSMQ